MNMTQLRGAFDLDFRPKSRRRLPSQWSEIKLLEDFSPWVLQCLRKISTFATLPEDWDSYGSRAIQPTAISTAIKFMSEVPVGRVPEPSVSPVSGGGIGFHWQVADRDLEIEFLADGTAEFMKRNRSNPEQSEEGALSDFSDTRLWRWLAGEHA
jgi:hypothetical protein